MNKILKQTFPVVLTVVAVVAAVLVLRHLWAYYMDEPWTRDAHVSADVVQDDGEDVPGKGFATMSDAWFDQNVFQIAVCKEHLSDELSQALDTEPIELPLWDRMN